LRPGIWLCFGASSQVEERLVRDGPGPAREVLQAGLRGEGSMGPWDMDKLQGGAPHVEVGL